MPFRSQICSPEASVASLYAHPGHPPRLSGWRKWLPRTQARPHGQDQGELDTTHTDFPKCLYCINATQKPRSESAEESPTSRRSESDGPREDSTKSSTARWSSFSGLNPLKALSFNPGRETEWERRPSSSSEYSHSGASTDSSAELSANSDQAAYSCTAPVVGSAQWMTGRIENVPGIHAGVDGTSLGNVSSNFDYGQLGARLSQVEPLADSDRIDDGSGGKSVQTQCTSLPPRRLFVTNGTCNCEMHLEDNVPATTPQRESLEEGKQPNTSYVQKHRQQAGTVSEEEITLREALAVYPLNVQSGTVSEEELTLEEALAIYPLNVMKREADWDRRTAAIIAFSDSLQCRSGSVTESIWSETYKRFVASTEELSGRDDLSFPLFLLETLENVKSRISGEGQAKVPFFFKSCVGLVKEKFRRH